MNLRWNGRLILLCFILCAAFQNVHADVFIPVFVDPATNLSWTKALSVRYANGCVDSKGNYYPAFCDIRIDGRGLAWRVDGSLQVDPFTSDAAKACNAIDARLPTVNEYRSLMRQFDHDVRGRLTIAGVAQMQNVFGDMDSKFWWTSTIGFTLLEEDYKQAYGFSISEYGPEKGIASVWSLNRDKPGAVRCVKSPPI